MPLVTTTAVNDIVKIVIDNPPLNTLSSKVAQELYSTLESIRSASQAKAIVLTSNLDNFSAGADITEFGQATEGPHLPELCELMATFEIPIIAALRGVALGGGCELALACHARVAAPSLRIGLPEVKLGILPGGGGTRRLPRIVGITAALEMMTSGEAVSADAAMKLGLIDRIVDADRLHEDAIDFAQTFSGAAARRQKNLDRLTDENGEVAAFRASSASRFAGLDAPNAIIGCVEAYTQMPQEGEAAFEFSQFEMLVETEQSIALRHVFFAQRKASKIDDVPPDVKPRTISKVGIIGAGTMGGGIAMNFLSAGMPVMLVEQQQAALDRGIATIQKNYDASARKGRISEATVQANMERLTSSLTIDALSDCDLIIEAVFEDIDVKKAIFQDLGRIAKPGTILATNTSFLNVDEIAKASGRPGDVLGLHFFSPANVMKLLEIVRGEHTALDVLATGMALAKKTGKVAVVSRVCYGFIANRILLPRQNEAMALLLEGATPAQIDKIHIDFGMPMGPMQMADLAGIDLGWHRDATVVNSLQDAFCAAGRLGQKTSAGFYNYDERRRSTESPEALAIVEDYRAKVGAPARAISDEEIFVRTFYPMVNEAVKILDEGIAQRASDIDVTWVFGFGWPAIKGGPLCWADSVGAAEIVNGLQRFSDRLPSDFIISPLLIEKAASGGTFTR